MSAPHVLATVATDRVLLTFVLASLPAALVGLWNVGAQAAATSETVLVGWRGDMLRAIGVDLVDPSWLECVLLGGAFFVPLVLVVGAVSILSATAFSRLRGRPLDPGWLVTAWLFTLLLPATVPVHFAALGVSFGIVFGSQIFGGTGRYLVSPALLGVVFLGVAYPGLFAAGQWLPASSAPATWTALAASGVDGAAALGLSWIDVFAGRQVGALGASSALACLLGAALLVYRGAASLRTVLGAVAGLAITSLLLESAAGAAVQIPWHWHVALGSFAFGVAFIATDPTTAPLTAAGRWVHGAMIGALTILIRAVNPDHPEGTLYALLLASLFTPLIDHIVVRMHVRRRQRRLARLV